MASSNPDPQAVAKVAGELFDLQTAMHDKAEAAGVAQYLPMRGMGMGGGMMGHRMKGMKGGQGGMMGGQGKPGGNPGQGPTGAAPQQQ
jgi:hypothetical protein